MSVFATKFARDVDAETLAPLRSFVYTDDQWQREGEAGIKNKLEYLFQSYYEASQWKMEVKDLQCEFDSVL